MKKFLFTIFTILMLVSASYAAHMESNFQFGLNLYGSADGEEGGDLDFFSPTIDMRIYGFFFPETTPLSNFGIGLGWGFKYATTTDKNFGWMYFFNDGAVGDNFIMPVYASFKAKLNKNPSITPYLFTDIGYSFWWASDEIDCPHDRPVFDCYTDGGFYFAFGAGLDLKYHLNLAISYSMFSGSIYTKYRYSGYLYTYNPEIDFGFLNLSVGFHF